MTNAAPTAGNPESDAAGIGRLLSRRRAEKGMAVESVAQELHLQVRQVVALEKGDFSGFSSPAFIKGYLRACARLYSMDGDALVNTYEASLPQLKTYSPAVVVSSERIILASGRSNKAVMFIALSVFFLAAICFLLWFTLGRDSIVLPFNDGEPVQSVPDVSLERPAVSGALPGLDNMSVAEMPVAAPAEINTTLQAGENRQVIAPTESPVDSVLHIEFVDDCWVQLKSDDGKVVHEKVHKKGEILDMPVKTPVHVWFGRAGAVNVSYNGAVVPVPVKPGYQSAQFVLGDELPSSEIE